MKKVIMVFLGLVLLSQVCKFYERGQAASVKRHTPVRMHPARPDHGGEVPVIKAMLA